MRNLRKTTVLSFIFTLIYAMNVYAQGDYMPIGAKPWRNIDEMEAVDSGRVRIWYALNALDITNQDTYDDWQCLEIGNNLSRYYSYFIYLSDSACTELGKKNSGAQSFRRRCNRGGKKANDESGDWSEYYFTDYVKDFSTGQLTVSTQMTVTLPSQKYTEEISVQNWEISDDTLTVAGYLCQKATCRFRGRDFTAWFTPEIPISNGPWKFGGLPGLIMKVRDADNLFLFECVKIENQPYKIYLADYNKFGKTTREKLSKLNKELHEDYAKTVGLQPMEGYPFHPPPRSEYAYQPLELE